MANNNVTDFFADETQEEIDDYNDLHISLILDAIRENSTYEEIKESLFDSTISFDKFFYEQLLIVDEVKRSEMLHRITKE